MLTSRPDVKRDHGAEMHDDLREVVTHGHRVSSNLLRGWFSTENHPLFYLAEPSCFLSLELRRSGAEAI